MMRSSGFGLALLFALILLVAARPSKAACLSEANRLAAARRGQWELSGDTPATWSVRRLDQEAWQPAVVPSANEDSLAAEGLGFEGALQYRLQVKLSDLVELRRDANCVSFLHFDAVATHCIVDAVTGDGRPTRLGEHLGGWTPFRIDVSTLIQDAEQDTLTLLVTVDEKTGHNTQGFLPIIEPHFGGIWQPVRLLQVAPMHLDDLRLGVQGVFDRGLARWIIDGPLQGTGSAAVGDTDYRVAFRYREQGSADWQGWQWLPLPEREQQSQPLSEIEVELPAERVRPWTPQDPVIYEYELRLSVGEPGAEAEVDRVTGTTGFRSIEVRGRELWLNGHPLNVRGILNWGYSTRELGPTRGEAQMRQELELARAWGFNLMKFCLWVPPRRYFELADEMGMMVWVEYPTWHPQLTREFNDELVREYDEFYRLDRRHPSIMLRSLTCETGHSADLGVLQLLYDLGKQRVPGAIIEDDSSWIEWNRLHDFYDDHPYGNNHTWPATVQRLQQYIEQRQAKPLMLGEAIAADTWFISPEITGTEESRPFWLPGFAEANGQWVQQLQQRLGQTVVDQLEPESKRYAWLMRKYQMEHFRQAAPTDGYVVSVIRDFPLAGMGLIDYRGEPKWHASDWGWHGDAMVTLRTPGDCRSWRSGDALDVEYWLHNNRVEKIPAGELKVELVSSEPHETKWTLGSPGTPSSNSPQVISQTLIAPPVNRPTRFTLRVKWVVDAEEPGEQVVADNAWELWVMPQPQSDVAVARHASWQGHWGGGLVESTEPNAARVVLTRRLDADVLRHLETGGNVLLVCEGEAGSFQQQSQWFLRGGPVVAEGIPLEVPREFWIDLQHFDLAGEVIPQWQAWDAIDPWVMLWDNHDIKEVKTHGLLFEMPVGQGRLIVSSLNHFGRQNAAGEWLVHALARELDQPVRDPGADKTRAARNLRRLSGELNRRELRLGEQRWKFHVDSQQQGEAEGWFKPQWPDGDWKEIRIDRHWDGQGYETLDGWAWYRITVTLPEDWDSPTTYLSFTGVDDHYRAYVNGQLIGTGGVIETKQTAFEERASHDISKWVKPGEPVSIAIAVYDWYGAGGIFRPVSLSSEPLSTDPPWLK